MPKSVAPSRERGGTQIDSAKLSPQAKAMMFVIGYLDGRVEGGFKSFVDPTKTVPVITLSDIKEAGKAAGLTSNDFDFLDEDFNTLKTQLNDAAKKYVHPALRFDQTSSTKDSSTLNLASSFNKMKSPTSELGEQDKQNIRGIVKIILNSPAREGFLIYMQAHLGKQRFLDLLSICMDSRSLKKLDNNFDGIVRFSQLGDETRSALYSRLSNLIRNNSKEIVNLLSENLEKKKYDLTESVAMSPPGILEYLMITPKQMVSQVTTRMMSDNSEYWKAGASKAFDAEVKNYTEDDLNILKKNGGLKSQEIKFKTKYILNEKINANKKEQEQIKNIYKELYGQYVPNEFKEAFKKEFDNNRFAALKFIRNDRKFNPFMYARVFVDGLAQEYMNAIDKLSKGTEGSKETPVANRIAKGIITVFRTAIALPLRVLADPVGVVQAIGTSIKNVIKPIVTQFRKWREDLGKTKEEKEYNKSNDMLNALKKTFDHSSKINDSLDKKSLSVLSSFISSNITDLVSTGLISTSSKDTISHELKLKLKDALTGEKISFYAKEISLLFKHMANNVSKLHTDLVNGILTPQVIKKLFSEATTHDMNKAIKATEDSKNIPHLDLSTMNNSEASQQLQEILNSARGDQSPSSSSDYQSTGRNSIDTEDEASNLESSRGTPKRSSSARVLSALGGGGTTVNFENQSNDDEKSVAGVEASPSVSKVTSDNNGPRKTDTSDEIVDTQIGLRL